MIFSVLSRKEFFCRSLNFLKTYNNLDGNNLTRRYREVAKKLVAQESNITNMSFMATFAETVCFAVLRLKKYSD